MSSATYRVTDEALPPFFRGCGRELPPSYCDYLLDDGSQEACDDGPAYLVHWTPQPEYDGDTTPVSGVCELHVVEVDRSRVVQVATHPDVLRRRRSS